MIEKQCDIIVIGAGLTGLATAHNLRRRNKEVMVLEKELRPGGTIQTYEEKGFTFESGPNTGVVSCPEVAELFDSLRGKCKLETAQKAAHRRLIWKGNRFHELPCSLLKAITTPLITTYDKFRILGEPWRSKGTNPNESIGELTRRRLGASYLHYAVDPFLSGVYAGDPLKLVTRFAIPKLYRLEQDYGSFIRGAKAKAKEPKTARDRLATKEVFSAQGGMERLVEAMVESIGKERIVLGASQITVEPSDQGWTVRYTLTSTGELITIHCHKVVTTVGAYALPSILPFISSELMNPISSLLYGPVVQVCVGVPAAESPDYRAFGGLVPSCEHQKILGVLFPSSCFIHRAPEGGQLFSFFIGGVRHPEYLEQTDAELTATVTHALRQMLKLPANRQPSVIRIFRHAKAIPQYMADTEQRYAALESLGKQYANLYIAGNLRDGIGMADRIKQAAHVAAQL